MKFLVTIMEEHNTGVGTGCYGHLNLPDGLVFSPNYDALCKALSIEFTDLLAGMLRALRAV
jgi:hypothetical protein